MPPPDRQRHDDRAHDVLAAEEFGMPAPDPILHHHAPVTLPSDPTGIAEPHDVLAAEEFALPAGRLGVTGLPAPGASAGRSRAVVGLAAVVLVAMLRRFRRS